MGDKGDRKKDKCVETDGDGQKGMNSTEERVWMRY
jgi:hypothetical protein